MRDGDVPMPPHHPTPPVPYVDHPVGVAALQVVEHRGLVEVRQHGHVLNHVKLGGIHGLHLVLLHHPCLSEEGDASEGPQPSLNTLCPKSCRVEGHPESAVLGTALVPVPAAILAGLPSVLGDRPRAAPAAPSHKAQLGQASPACSFLRETGSKLFPHNVLDSPILCFNSQPKSPCQCCPLLQRDLWLFRQTAEACTPSL